MFTPPSVDAITVTRPVPSRLAVAFATTGSYAAKVNAAVLTVQLFDTDALTLTPRELIDASKQLVAQADAFQALHRELNVRTGER